mmetsp:Transcript_2424/g.5676  ORF Transcript_2424/g.5676 Transcript_2424/m.5676 type:complete len:143 (-) Transcript_2424:599-1027(-)
MPLKKFIVMSDNRIKNLEISAELILDENLQSTFFKKRSLVESFWIRPVKTLRSIEELNELDLAESLNRYYRRVQSLGRIGGLITFAACWHTILRGLQPLPKALLGGLFIHYGGEYNLYRHIDEFYVPLKQLYSERYKPRLTS